MDLKTRWWFVVAGFIALIVFMTFAGAVDNTLIYIVAIAAFALWIYTIVKAVVHTVKWLRGKG